MHTSVCMQDRPSIGRKLLGGIGLLVFLGAFFVVPLWAAIAICTMPCCEHGDQNGGATLESAAMMACETECAIRSDEATSTVPSVGPESSAARGVPVVVVITAAPERSPIAAITGQHSSGFLRGSDASLQILNSTFRI